MDTKACNLTEDEVRVLLQHHGLYIHSEPEWRIERINYLNKRLKTFNEPEVKEGRTEADIKSLASSTPTEKVGW